MTTATLAFAAPNVASAALAPRLDAVTGVPRMLLRIEGLARLGAAAER